MNYGQVFDELGQALIELGAKRLGGQVSLRVDDYQGLNVTQKVEGKDPQVLWVGQPSADCHGFRFFDGPLKDRKCRKVRVDYGYLSGRQITRTYSVEGKDLTKVAQKIVDVWVSEVERDARNRELRRAQEEERKVLQAKREALREPLAKALGVDKWSVDPYNMRVTLSLTEAQRIIEQCQVDVTKLVGEED